jgi:enamine deaminase RidA (YjgF/YER057c/UK114 family)
MKSRLLITVLLFAITATAQSDRKFLKSKVAAERHLPFSSGVLVDHTLYIAGATAELDKLSAGVTPEDEAKSVMEQIRQTVESAGMTMDDVVSIQVFCTDLTLYDAFNRVYSKYFHDNFPARAFIGASKLLFGAHFEVNGIAVAKH